MVWGPMIAWYLFLAGASAGAFLTSAFVEVKYPESVKMRVAGRIIAPIFLGIGLVMLMLDAEAGLHNPLRFFWLIANPGSVMTLGVYFICVYMPVALAVAVLEILKKRVPKWLTWIGIVAAFAVAAYTGFLLGVVKAYPLWNNAILPILFVVSALSAGLAATSLVGLIVDRERFEQMWLIKKSHVILSAVEMVVLATMLIIVSAGSFEGAASVYSLVAGQYAPAFWGGIVLLGLVAPFLIEGYPVFIAKRVETSTTSMVVSVIGEAGVLVGGFMLRLLVVLSALPVLYRSALPIPTGAATPSAAPCMKRALARCEGPSCVKGLACGAGRPLPQSARRRPWSAGAREDSHIGAISPDPCAGHAEESSVGRDRALCTIPRRFLSGLAMKTPGR